MVYLVKMVIFHGELLVITRWQHDIKWPGRLDPNRPGRLGVFGRERQPARGLGRPGPGVGRWGGETWGISVSRLAEKLVWISDGKSKKNLVVLNLWKIGTSTAGWWFGTFFIFPHIGNNPPNWPYFSEGFKPPTRLCIWWLLAIWSLIMWIWARIEGETFSIWGSDMIKHENFWPPTFDQYWKQVQKIVIFRFHHFPFKTFQDKTRVYLLNGDGTCSAPHQRWGLWLSPNETMRKHWEIIRLTIQNIYVMLYCLSLFLSIYIYITWYMIYIYTPVISVISAIYQLYKFSHPCEVAQVTNIKVGCPHPC